MLHRSVKVSVRLSEEEDALLKQAAKEQGYLNSSAFVRAGIRNELNGRDEALTDVEQRIAATLERLSREVFRLHRGQQALFAVVDTLVKTFLTCVPEPPRDGIAAAVARARGRYDHFVKSAGQAMVGDAHAAMRDLMNDE